MKAVLFTTGYVNYLIKDAEQATTEFGLNLGGTESRDRNLLVADAVCEVATVQF